MSETTGTQRWHASKEIPDMWVDPDDDPRERGATETTGERDTLIDYLRRYRMTLQLKCDGLSAEQLARRSVPPSTMSLLGLVRHMADVERGWFRRVMSREDAPAHYSPADTPDGDFDGAVADDAVVEDAWATWHAEVAYAEAFVDTHPDLSFIGVHRDGTRLELRDILVHMIEEYARHCGHADLLRECIDGRVGQ